MVGLGSERCQFFMTEELESQSVKELTTTHDNSIICLMAIDLTLTFITFMRLELPNQLNCWDKLKKYPALNL